MVDTSNRRKTDREPEVRRLAFALGETAIRLKTTVPIAGFHPEGLPVKARPRFTVSDGELVLVLEPAEEGGYLVESPLDPELVTQAETLEGAFENARDAALALREARRKLQILFKRASEKSQKS